ncbi:MAG: dienelactone hydrolase family protein [Actinomycetota bacterium]
MTTVAPDGDLNDFTLDTFEADGVTHPIYRRGTGPAVIIITELPGITPQVLGFANRVVAIGCSVVLPQLYGTPGRRPFEGSRVSDIAYNLRSSVRACVSREFSAFALNKTSPIANWLRALARAEHQRCGGPGVGAVGMCFSGGFSLAMATDPSVVAPVMSQPSLPLGLNAARRGSIDVSPDDLDVVASRCTAEGLRVLGLRFNGDRLVPGERFAYLAERLGDGFVAVELEQADGNPAALDNPVLSDHHSVLTGSLIDEVGQPTRDTLDRVLELFTARLLTE